MPARLADATNARPQRTIRTPTPYSGWVLGRAVELDRQCPGLLAASFLFGDLRRQAMFLVLALIETVGIDEVAGHLRISSAMPDFGSAEACEIVGRAILHARRPRDLVGSVLAGPPVGLLGTLGRLGADPIPEPRTYHELARLYLSREPIDRRRVKVLAQISRKLVGAQIEIVSTLDPLLLHPNLVAHIYEVRQVAEIHNALAYIRQRCSGANDDAIRASASRIKPNGHRHDLIKGWAARFDRLPAPLDTRGDATLEVLSSAAALVDAGHRYKNCLSTKNIEAILGARIYVEYRPTDPREPGVIAELRRTSQGFLLEGLFASKNRRVLPERAEIVRAKLAACGVALLACAPGDPAEIQAAAQFLGEHDILTPDCEGWGREMLEIVGDHEDILDEAA